MLNYNCVILGDMFRPFWLYLNNIVLSWSEDGRITVLIIIYILLLLFMVLISLASVLNLLYFYYYYYYYYYYYTIWMSIVTDVFFPVLLLNQRWSPPLTLQASHCSTFRIMCDVPSIAVFCSESIECFPDTVSKFFLKLLVTIPVAPIITGTIVHFRFHIRCISIHKLLYFNFFSASFCTTFLYIIIISMSGLHFVRHILGSTYFLSSVCRGVERPKCVALLQICSVPRLGVHLSIACGEITSEGLCSLNRIPYANSP